MKIIDKNKLYTGIFLVLLGIFLPYFININTFRIDELILKSVVGLDRLYLVLSGIFLVALNSIRAFPHYIGAFMISESITTKDSNKTHLVKPIIIFLTITFVYYIISAMDSTPSYHFGVPAITMIILITAIGRGEYNYVSSWKKNLLIIFIITALQFLDINPSLDKLPFGRGETSLDIKLISYLLGIDRELSYISFSFFILFMLFSFFLFLLIKEENNIRYLDYLKDENLKLEKENESKELQNRMMKETRSLMHDLKSPLTSAQFLVSLLEQSNLDRDKELEYLSKIDNSLLNMDKMVSEILNENKRYEIKTKDLINTTLANIVDYNIASIIKTNNNVEEAIIYVNKIVTSRVLVNLILNSYDSVKHLENGEININLYRKNIDGKDFIDIDVVDNGLGIDKKEIERIWESGYSTKDSYGLGLSFVKESVINNGGEINIRSEINKGTVVSILFLEVVK